MWPRHRAMILASLASQLSGSKSADIMRTLVDLFWGAWYLHFGGVTIKCSIETRLSGRTGLWISAGLADPSPCLFLVRHFASVLFMRVDNEGSWPSYRLVAFQTHERD
jgi:hypothetical protein